MKAKFKFTKADFKLWLKSTNARMIPCDARQCVLAKFTGAMGVRRPWVVTSWRDNQHDSHALPKWACRIRDHFDTHDEGSVSARVARQILKDVLR